MVYYSDILGLLIEHQILQIRSGFLHGGTITAWSLASYRLWLQCNLLVSNQLDTFLLHLDLCTDVALVIMAFATVGTVSIPTSFVSLSATRFDLHIRHRILFDSLNYKGSSTPFHSSHFPNCEQADFVNTRTNLTLY